MLILQTWDMQLHHHLDDKAPVSKIKIEDQQKLAEKIALSLKEAKNPLIISGINCGDEEIIACSFKYCQSTFVI